jgi:hypothetical protein
MTRRARDFEVAAERLERLAGHLPPHLSAPVLGALTDLWGAHVRLAEDYARMARECLDTERELGTALERLLAAREEVASLLRERGRTT